MPWKRERKASGRKIPEQSGDCSVKEEGEEGDGIIQTTKNSEDKRNFGSVKTEEKKNRSGVGNRWRREEDSLWR